MLYVIPTPIGNSQDITLRALSLFRELNQFICEDTRTFRKLLGMYDIDYTDKKFHSLTSYTWDHQLAHYQKLFSEWDVGLVSEAWCPWLSDPGKVLIQFCVENDVEYTVLPWANALVPAIVAAWFPSHQFRFVGFIPQKKWKQTLLREIIESREAVFAYESVHRIEKTLKQLSELWFVWKVSIARELSKMFEQLVTWSLEDVLDMFQKKEIPLKGEFVVGFYSE